MNRTDLTIIKADWNQYRSELSRIRYEVFVNEQGVPASMEVDEHDSESIHFLVFLKTNAETGSKAIATARLLPGGYIGRMAVLKPFRNQSVGSILLETVIDTARSRSINNLTLNAQTEARPFYERAGFTVDGEEFIEAGIPHIRMTRKL